VWVEEEMGGRRKEWERVQVRMVWGWDFGKVKECSMQRK
jgi:hypothetical protein